MDISKASAAWDGNRTSRPFLAAALVVSLLGCGEKKADPTAPTASASAAVTAPSAPAASASAPPTASAVVEVKPTRPCPEGATGDGTFSKPCEAKGAARLMEVTWTGKMTDTGPSFRVTNKSKLDILYGSMAAYFYDKAGKQLDVPAADGKTRPKQVCAGKIFDGVMKAGEKATITFSCVKKTHVPEGTAHVEAEMQMVGFVDSGGKTTDLYWKNNELTPDARPKGGAKK
jgi:pyruvate/2-oxoglutarate dehydrogenase complex dihydrolipoamide acyltransferase (E2) component